MISALEKIQNSLKAKVYVIFTEVENYVKRSKPIDNSLTVTIEMIDLHSQGQGTFYFPKTSEIVFEYFRTNFMQINLNNHIVYQIITRGGNKINRKSIINRKQNKKSLRH